jgi:putative transposase
MSKRVLGPQEWFTAAELAIRVLPGLPATKRGVQMTAERQGWARREGADGQSLARARKGRGGGLEYHLSLLPEAAQAKLALVDRPRAEERPDRESSWARFERLPAGMKAAAQERLAVIQSIEDLMRAGLGKEKALQTVVDQARRVAAAAGEDAPYVASTVRGWFARIAGVDPSDRLAYLAPDYQGRAAGELDRAAFDHFAGDYLRLSKPTLAACYGWLQRAADKNGWTVPSLKTLQRRLDAEIPQDVQKYLREGDNALAHAFPHLERSRAGIGALQIINLDGHTWDNLVEWPDGTIGRPLSVAVQDIASGKCLGIRFDKTLNQHLVRLALADTFRDHGIPDTCIMDNGRENAAASIAGGQPTRWRWKIREDEPAGLLKTLGIKAVFATPYWGQAKPIERMFRDWAGEIAKHPAFEGSYTGPDTASKPANYGSRAIPIAEYEAQIREELVHYNARLGRTGPHMAGRSFDQVYEQLSQARPPRRATAEQLRLGLLASQPVHMDPRSGAVRVADHRYWAPELGALKAQKVVVRFDPERLADPVHVYSLDGRYLAQANRIAAGSFDNAADAQAHGRDRRAYQKAVKAVAKAKVRLDAAGVAAALPTPANAPVRPARKTAGNVVTAAFGVPRTAEAATPTNSFAADWEKGAALLAGGGG